MTKAIIFDLGGIILNPESFTPSVLAQLFNISEDEVFTIYNQDLEDKWVMGNITASGVIEKFKTKFPNSESTESLVSKWQQIFLDQTKVDTEILNFIDKLRKKYPVYLLTNTTKIHSGLNRKRNIYNHFDKVYESSALGMRKPNEDIYQYVLKDLGLKPQECFFTDDRQVHIDGAQALGIDAVIFESQEQLKQELLNRGISL